MRGNSKITKPRYTTCPQNASQGEIRSYTGTTPTDYTYTGQYSHTADFGLMFYSDRWYDPGISMFTSPDTIIPDPYNSLDYNRYSYVRYNPIRYNDPSGHMCSDPDDPTPSCEGGTRLSGGGSLGNPKSMSVYQKRKISAPSIDLLGKVFGLANGDMTLVGAWAQLYQTQSGYQYAMYIVNNDIRMMWGTDLDASYSFCANGGCWIEFVPSLKPDVSDDPIYAQEKAFNLVATMGHEGYHQAYGHPVYYGDPTTDSQAEEFLAFATDYALAVELSGSGSTNKFDGYYLNDEDSLFVWINKYAESYKDFPPYPPYIP